MDLGDLLSKLIIYCFVLNKYSARSPHIHIENNRIMGCIQNIIHNIETILIEYQEESSHLSDMNSEDKVTSELTRVWDDTYNCVLPQLILYQLSASSANMTF